MSRATIREVAQTAGVSIATVSNVLNNPSIVKPDTVKRVQQAIESLEYTPNANGRRLRSGESMTIGLFMKSIANEYYYELTNSLFLTCRDEGYELQICLGDSQRSLLPRLYDHSLDGMVVFQDNLTDSARKELLSGILPVVFLAEENRGERVSSILYNSEEHGRLAADYMMNQGRKHIMHVHGRPGNYDAMMRWKGFREQLISRGYPEGEILELQADFYRQEAYSKMRKYLQDGNPVPDALFAANDLSALGCMSALQEAGYRVPEDVGVIGCDDIVLCQYITPNLTTIATGFRETGTLAAKEIIRLIHGGKGQIIRQSGALVERASCRIQVA